MLKEKKIEVVQVKIKTVDESELKFEDILLNTDFHNIDVKSGGKFSQFVYIQNYPDYVVGIVQSTKMDSTPPKRNVTTNVTSPLGLLTEEGLAYGNVFLFDKIKSVLLYETTRDGLFIGQLDSFIYDLVRDYPDIIKFDVKFHTLMNADAMEKLLKMGDKKAIHIQFANPEQMLAKIKNEQKSLKEIASPGKALGADIIDVIYKIGAHKTNYLHNGPVNKMIEFINNKFDLLKENVKKFSIKGYEEDEDKMTEVDFIKDKMIEKIKYTDTKNMADLRPTERKQEIILAYDRLKTDIYRYL